jgi:hypothetical protein
MPFKNPYVVNVGRRCQFVAMSLDAAAAEYKRLRDAAVGCWPPAKVYNHNCRPKPRLCAVIGLSGRVFQPGSEYFDMIKTKRGF